MFTLPPAAARDPFDDIAAQEIGSAIGRNIAGAINAAVEMRRAAAQASTEIDVARRAYWEAVRTGRGVDAAKVKFKFIMTEGTDKNVARRTVAEAVRDYDRFVMAYGEEAVATVGKSCCACRRRKGRSTSSTRS